MRGKRGGVVLVGGALEPETVEAYPRVSAAAAKWQLDFARAIAAEWGAPVTCLSYLPLGPADAPADRPTVRDGVEVVPVPRSPGPGGAARYALGMLRAAWRLRGSTAHVFCYNPLVWTLPWARLLGALAGARVVLIVADLDPRVAGPLRERLRIATERVLLRWTRRYLALSPAFRKLAPAGTRVEVFNGLADAAALACPAPRYEGRVRFVYAGSLTAEVGADAFLAAAEALAAEGADCEFHLFGRGSLPGGVSPELAGRIRFHGFVSEAELNRFMGEGCVGVNPRRVRGAVNQYNAPYKLLYYLSRGVATLTTRTEGVPEDLLEVCILADDGPEGLAAAMRRTLAMPPAELARVAAAGRERVRRTRSAAALAAVARELTGSGPERRERGRPAGLPDLTPAKAEGGRGDLRDRP